MRFLSVLPCIALATMLSACASIPGLNDIPLWHGDPVKLERLGKGAPMSEVDKALGRTRVLSTETINAAGSTYQVRLYDWVENVVHKRTVCNPNCTLSVDHVKVPYVIVYTGSEPRLHSWGRLDQLGKADEPALAGLSTTLTLRYYQLKRSR